MAARDPFRSPFVGEDPIDRAKRQVRRREHWRNTVLRRQRILNARGFDVPVDGNWTKKVSSSWWRFNRGLPPLAGREVPRAPVMGENAAEKARTFTPEPKFRPPTFRGVGGAALRAARERAKQPLPKPDLSHAGARALAQAPKRPRGERDVREPVPTARDLIGQKETRARRSEVAKIAIKADADARFKKAWKKKEDPRKWDTRDIVALFADPVTRVKDWEDKPEWVNRLQLWLAAHGQDVQITGVWDAQTADGMKAEMTRRERNFQKFRAAQLARRIYGPLGMKAGDKGFPFLGVAPTPEQLLKIIDAGGFTAEMLSLELGRRLQDVNLQAAWRRYQNEFLDTLLMGGESMPEAGSVFGPFLSPLIASQMTPAQKYAAILLGYAAQGVETGNKQSKKGDTFFQNVQAVVEAHSEEDLKRRVARIQRIDEVVFGIKMGQRSGEPGFFTRGAIAVAHALGYPAESFQDGAAEIAGVFSGLTDPEVRARAIRGLADPRSATSVYRELALDAAMARAAFNQWEEDHAVLGFGLDLVADPLNLIPAAWVGAAWKGTKAGVKAVERAGEISRAATAEAPLPLRLVGGGTGGAMKLPAATGRFVQGELRGARQAIKNSKVGRVNRAVKESVDDVTRTVKVALHHGFRPSAANDIPDVGKVKDEVRKLLEGVQVTDPTTGRKFDILEELERLGVGTHEELNALFTDFINLAARERLSLYTHQGRGTISDFGASSRATFASFSWSMHADRYAANLARKEYERVLDGLVGGGVVRSQEFVDATSRLDDLLRRKKEGRGWTAGDEALLERAREDWHRLLSAPARRVVRPTVKHRIPTIREPQHLALPDRDFDEMLKLIAQTESERVYRQVMKDIGSYLGGGKFELRKLIQAQVEESIGLLDRSFFPMFQSAIEKSLDDFEQGLLAQGLRPENWKPSGLYASDGAYAVGNRAKSTDLLRDILRETFDDLDVQYGIPSDKAGKLKSVKKYRAARLAEIEEEFKLREQALRERAKKSDKDLAGMKLALRGRFPILISKKDKSIIFGGEDVNAVLSRSTRPEEYLLAEARLGADNKVESISQRIIDLETGELRYDPGDFADEDVVTTVERGQEISRPQSDDPKFQKAIEDLKRLNKRITEMQNRKRQAARAKDERIRAEAWTERDQKDLNNLRASKRRLIKNNPATETYFLRGTVKRSVARHVEGLLRGRVDETIEPQRLALAHEKAEAIGALDNEVAKFAASQADERARAVIEIENADEGRVFSQDEYDEYVAMEMENRTRSVHQWAARRRAVGDMSGEAIERAVTKELDDHLAKVEGYFVSQGDGTFKMTAKRIKVPAIYARHHFKAYDDALKGRHPILTAADVPPDIKRVLSLAATPADRATGAVQAMERLASLVSGARPFPVWKKFGDDPNLADRAVKGRTVQFERARANRVGVAEGTRMADEVREWNERINDLRRQGWDYTPIEGDTSGSFLARANAYQGLLKVAADHAYGRVSFRQGAWVRALKEAQSGPLRTLNDLLGMSRELFVFSVLPARPGATVRNVVDSVVKILISGLHDPRYWLVSGKTAGEESAHKKLSAITDHFLAASFPTAYRVPGAVREYLATARQLEDWAQNQFDASWFGRKQREALETVSNVFQLGIKELEVAIKLLVGPKYAEAMAARFRHVFDTAFWGRPISDVRKMLVINGVTVPDEVVFGIQTILKNGEETRMLPRERPSLEDWAAINKIDKADVEDWIKQVTANPKLLNETRNPVFVMLSHVADVNWDLMVGRVEGFLRRGLYRSAYAKAKKRGLDDVQAMNEGLRAVDRALFDYSKLTTLEENFRHVAPFLFFWRRNLGFWATESIRKPWLPASIVKFEEMMDQANAERPEWARRYLRIPYLSDAVSRLPLVNWLLPTTDSFEVGTDPMSFLSAAPLYRAFKGSNPTLPADRAGLPFISDIVEGMNDFGLSMSPWFRKPLELAGAFDYRAWQSMFPQTGLLDAFTERFLNEMFPGGLNFEEVLQDSLFEAIGASLSAKELNERRVNEFVQLEVAAQAERGEPVDRAAAEQKVRQFLYLQTVFAFASGAYLRHLDPAQLNLYRIQQQLVLGELDFLDLDKDSQRAYRLFVRRKLDPGAYNSYLAALPKIETYYAIEDFDRGQEYLQENPEVIPHVLPQFTGKPAFRGKQAMKNIAMVVDTDATMTSLKAFELSGVKEPGVRERLSGYFVTPELKEFWARNDTSAQSRDRMLQGEVYRYLHGLRRDYFAIPNSDHQAKQEFLKENPLLAHSFTINDEASDDLLDVLNYVNSDLREVYFEMVERDDWEGAAEFLKRFPRIFEFTRAADRVSDDGVWLPAARNTQRSKDYLAARRHIEHYFALKQQNKTRAYKWLQGDTPGAKLARDYFTKYADPTKGSKSEHARAYVAMKPLLTWFFEALPKEGEFRGHHSKWEWVFESSDPAAVKLRNYFRKYGDKSGMSKQARDYVAIKGKMQHYFTLKEKDAEAAREWLHSDAGAGVLAYFKQYGKTNAAARRWGKWVRSRNPEINRRLMFWKRYFELEPDQRPGFVHSKAEEYGVFIWGIEEDRARHEKEQAYVRAAKKRHLTKKQALYLRVKPLLELMHSLDKRDTKILLRLNPDVREWLDTFGKGPDTGSKELDRKVEAYFKLEPDSNARAAYLRKNPEVQDYFDRKNPADAAMHNLLEVYFAIEDRTERQQFRDLHPEISDYFDRKREERSLLSAELRVFDEVDPRYAELRERAEIEIVHAAEVMWARLRGDMAARLAGDDLDVRRERDRKRADARRRRV